MDPRDDPSAESPAEREARLLAARSLEARFESHEIRIDAIERRHRAEDAALSDPVTVTAPGGWTVSGRGWYVFGIAALLVVAFFGWLVLK
jgi:hypothetical protein